MCHITNAEVPFSNMATKRRLKFFGCTSHAVCTMKTISVQLLLRFATSLHPTGNDLQEDPTTRGAIGAIESDLRPLNIDPS